MPKKRRTKVHMMYTICTKRLTKKRENKKQTPSPYLKLDQSTKFIKNIAWPLCTLSHSQKIDIK